MADLTVKGTPTIRPSDDYKIADKPFSIRFSYGTKSVIVELENAEDVLYLAKLYSVFLSENGIKNKLTEMEHTA